MDPNSKSTEPKRFRVALSFSGSKRDYVHDVAKDLASVFGEGHILYDLYHQAEFARPFLSRSLPDLYESASDLIVVFVSDDYADREWCGLEWNAISSFIMNASHEKIMLFNWNGAMLQDLRGQAGYIPADRYSSVAAADLILKRLAINEGLPPATYVNQRRSPYADRHRDVLVDGSIRGINAPRWSVGIAEELGPPEHQFEFHFEYPIFRDGTWLIANSHEGTFAEDCLSSMRLRTSSSPLQQGTNPSFLKSKFEVTLYCDAAVSVQHIVHTYFSGGAHGYRTTVSHNYSSVAGLLSLAQLFSDPNQSISILSQICIDDLVKRSGAPQNEEWIRRGCAADFENFRRWNLSKYSLTITFDEYDVGPYAEGSHTVWIPYSSIRPQASPLLLGILDAISR